MARKSYKRGKRVMSRRFRGRRGGGIMQLFGAPYQQCVPDKKRYDDCQSIARQQESTKSSSAAAAAPSFASGLGSLMTPAPMAYQQRPTYPQQSYQQRPTYPQQSYQSQQPLYSNENSRPSPYAAEFGGTRKGGTRKGGAKYRYKKRNSRRKTRRN